MLFLAGLMYIYGRLYEVKVEASLSRTQCKSVGERCTIDITFVGHATMFPDLVSMGWHQLPTLFAVVHLDSRVPILKPEHWKQNNQPETNRKLQTILTPRTRQADRRRMQLVKA